MLTKIRIQQLFNLYDYDIDLTNSDGSMVKFITAPNGYGKTTLLDFIEAAMRQSYDKMFIIPFKLFELFYNETGSNVEYRYVVERNDEKSAVSYTDIPQQVVKRLDVYLKKIAENEEKPIEQFSVKQEPTGKTIIEGSTENIQMFYTTHTHFYLNDHRTLSMKMDVVDETSMLGSWKTDAYPDEMKTILSSPVKSQEYADRIAAFRDIINRCDFANKHLEINPRYGFRFKADDELQSILTLDQLSSGEKQMVIQVYELLFRAQSGTLVMIDEPELSLHMMWQMNYLKNLSEISQLRGFQCIVATHSPQIFNSLWSKSVDLFTISNQE